MRKLFLLTALALVSCSDSLDNDLDRLLGFVADNRYGSSADVWLVKSNAFGDQERVALVFGFLDDWAFCAEVAELYMRKHPTDTYSCNIAN